MAQSSYVVPNHPDCKFNLIWNQKRLFSVVVRQRELSEELMTQNTRNMRVHPGGMVGRNHEKSGFARFAKRSKFGRKRRIVRSDTRSARAVRKTCAIDSECLNDILLLAACAVQSLPRLRELREMPWIALDFIQRKFAQNGPTSLGRALHPRTFCNSICALRYEAGYLRIRLKGG